MTLRRHLVYEWWILCRAHWLPWLVLSMLGVTAALALVVGTTARESWLLNDEDMWALAGTMGGTLGWPPMYAFFLALLGVLMWRDDCGGESATVAYATFPRRWRTALIRSATLTTLSACLSWCAVAVSLGVYVLVADMPSVSGQWTLILAKAAWATTCGVCFAHLGALMCVVARSALIGTSLLVIVPWVLEPILVEAATRVAGLSWLAAGVQFLPFRLAGDALGDPSFDALGRTTFAQLEPSSAGVISILLSVGAAAAVQWRYCASDADTGY